MIYRFLLLALLPIIAITIYLKGQKYDRATIDFKSSQIGNVSSFFPLEIDGFSKSGQTRIYTKDNLYEYINGHAEYFIGAGFISLSVVEYVKSGAEPVQSDAAVEIYNMGKGIHAFGVLVDEAGENTTEVQIGMMGYKTSQGLNFFTGQYYIKIRSFKDAVPLDKLARMINKNLGVKSESFSLFSRFPDIGEVVTTRFIKDGYRGLAFLHDVIEREYLSNGESIQVFLVTGDEHEIDKIATSFFDFFRQSEIKFIRIKKNGKIFYKVMDPYEGDWYLLPVRDALFGIYGAVNDTIVKYFFKNESKNFSFGRR